MAADSSDGEGGRGRDGLRAVVASKVRARVVEAVNA